MNEKQELLDLLGEIKEDQVKITECHDYYLSLEKKLEEKKKISPDDYENIPEQIDQLNKEYEEKIDLLYEDLNQVLIKGYDLAKVIGHETAHDFKALWDYMTNPTREEVDLTHVLHTLEIIRKDLIE